MKKIFLFFTVVLLAGLTLAEGSRVPVRSRVIKYRAGNGTARAQKAAITPVLTAQQEAVRSRMRAVVRSDSTAKAHEMTAHEKAEHEELVAFLLDLRTRRIQGEITHQEFDEKRANELKRRADAREKERKDRFRKLRLKLEQPNKKGN